MERVITKNIIPSSPKIKNFYNEFLILGDGGKYSLSI